MRKSVVVPIAAIFAAAVVPAAAQTTPSPRHPVSTGADAPTATTVAVKHTSRSFTFKSVPASGATATFTTFSFKALIGGTAVVRSRGYCNVLQEAALGKEINIESRIVGTAEFSTPLANWGVLRIPANASGLREQVGWTAEQQFRVVANTAYAIVLVGRHSSVTSEASDCTGTITMDIM